MTAVAAASGRSSGLAKTVLPLLGFLLVALLTRGWQFGNPLIHPDEQFYLLAGERILSGTVPYAEIWDSKPLGLFLLYAAIRLLGGDGILEYQVVATLFAAATAFVIHRIALRYTGAAAAAIAGVAYLLYLPAFGGVGGQSQVFYNLIVAAAGLLTFRLVDPRGRRPLPLRTAGALIMLLLGLCLQIKYSMLFEGVYFGLALLWFGWRSGRGIATLAIDAALWVACALVPTAALIATFFAAGYGTEFMQGNFLSILGRDDPAIPALGRLVLTAAMLIPFWICIRAAFRRSGTGDALIPGFVRGWMAAALAGYLVFGSYYDHYALPLLVPLALAAAPVLGFARDKRVLTILLLGVGLVMGIGKAVLDRIERGGTADATRMASLISPHLDGCLYVYEGDPILYKLTNACLATRFAFPGHLSNAKHIDSMGFDTVEEVRRIMAAGPAVIVAARYPRSLTNQGSRAALAEALRREYRLVETVAVGRKEWMIFERVGPGGGTADLPLRRPGGSGYIRL